MILELENFCHENFWGIVTSFTSNIHRIELY